MALPWVASILKWLGHAQYNSTPPTLAESEVSALQCDGSGNLKVNVVSGGGSIEFANVGSTVRAYWDQSAASAAIIRGFQGTFAAPNGVESFDITLGAGAPITVTPDPADTSAAAIVARINGTPGLSGVASVSNGAVVLTHATKIVVSGMADTLFPKIGIPNLTRDRGLTSATSIQMPIEFVGTEIELVSQAIAVPAGANRVCVVATLTNGALDNMGGEFMVGWGNSLVGDTISGLGAVPFLAAVNPTVANRSTDSAFGYQTAFASVFQLIGSFPATAIHRVFDLPVPAGATKLYLVPLTARSQSDASTPPRPRTPPSFSATVAFAAR